MVAARCAAKRAPAKARLPSARAACLARAPLRLTDTSGPAQTSETSQTARGLSAPVGGRALGLRSEGSWLAAELCAPGSSLAQLTTVQVGRAIARPALPKVRPRPPAPHAPRLAHAHLPCPSPRHWPSFAPISELIQSVCPDFRAGLDESFRTTCCTSAGHMFFACK